MNETEYQRRLIKKLTRMFPDSFILKNDPTWVQGIPDLLILFRDQWAMLEVKIARGAPEQANQDYYVNLFNGMSFAAFINPENEDQVLHALQSTFGVSR